jgi:hypothetical protein
MILIVEEINLLPLLSNRLLMTSRLATVGQTYPRKRIRGSAIASFRNTSVVSN